MLLKAARTRAVVLPLAALFLLFSGGAAYAPTCHMESTAHIHDHAAPGEIAQSTNISSEKDLNYEICFAVGVIVLLLFKFLHLKKLTPQLKSFIKRSLAPPITNSKLLSNLTLSHLQLGIIRI